jgi:hypothetical protein
MVRGLSFFFAVVFLLVFVGLLVAASHHPYREVGSLLVAEVTVGFFLMVGSLSPKGA